MSVNSEPSHLLAPKRRASRLAACRAAELRGVFTQWPASPTWMDAASTV